MSDILNDDDKGALAAEFVLGTLDAPERAGAQQVLTSDRSFIAMVKIWERRFGELHLMVEPVEPDPQLWHRIRGRIVADGGGAPAAAAVPAGTGVAAISPPAPTPAVAEGVAPVATEGEAVTAPAAPGLAADAAAEPAAAPEPLAAEVEALKAEMAGVPVPDPTERGVEAVAEAAPADEAAPAEGAPVVAAEPMVPVAPVRAPDPTIALPAEDRRAGVPDKVYRSRRRWRAIGVFMTLVAFALGGLIAAWRYAPERLPPQLRPLAILQFRLSPPPRPAPVRSPAPPDSQFDE